MKGMGSGGEPNPFPSQIAGRKRICDRRRPDVVSGSRRRCPEKRKRGGCASHRPGHLVNSILMCFYAPGGRTNVLRLVSSTRPLWGRQRCCRVYISPCVWRTPRIYNRLLLPALVASASTKCVHTIGGPASQFTATRER